MKRIILCLLIICIGTPTTIKSMQVPSFWQRVGLIASEYKIKWTIQRMDYEESNKEKIEEQKKNCKLIERSVLIAIPVSLLLIVWGMK